MPTLSDVFEQAAQVGINWQDEQARAEAGEALKKHLNPLYMAVNNLGFGAAQAKLQKQVEDALRDKKTAEDALSTERTTLQTRIRELEDKSPSVASINQQWEAKLKEADEKYQQMLATERSKTLKILHQRDQRTLEGELVARRIPAAMAKTLSKDPDLLPRYQYDEDGTLSVLQAGQQIPLTPGQGQTHLGLVADEIAATVDSDFKVSNGDRGSGVAAGNQPAGRLASGSKEYFERVREQAKQDQGGEQRVSLAERIKNRG